MGYHFREQESFVRIIELTPVLRKRIEAMIEHLVSILDEFDGDETLEDAGVDNEPNLGAFEHHPSGAYRTYAGHYRDRSGDQTYWSCFDIEKDEIEVEDEHGGDILDEPHDDQDEGEPWLGWTEAVNQTGTWRLACGVLLDGEMDSDGEPENSKSDNNF